MLGKFIIALIGIVFVIFIGFLLSYPMMLLWNSFLVPAIPSISTVGWLQMWGISTLIGILFSDKSVSTS